MSRRFGWSSGIAAGLLASVVALAAEPSPAPPAALGLTDLDDLALRHNLTLAQVAADIEGARARALQAGLYPNPTLGYVGSQIGSSGTAGELQGTFVQQTIVTAGKLRLSRAKYAQQARAAEIRATSQQLRVLNGIHVRFYDVLASRRMVELHRALVGNAEESLRTRREMFNTGQANRPEVLLAEVDLQRARIALRTVENRALASWVELAAVVGRPDLPADVALAGQLEPDDGPPLEWEASLRRLLEDSPELAFARAHVVHDEIMVRREEVQPIPDVKVQASTGYDFETLRAAAGAQVGIEVPLWNRNQGTIREAKADLARSRAEVDRVELSLRQRLAAVFNRYQTALETYQIQRDINIPKVREAYAIQSEMYQKRRAPWAEVVKLEGHLFEVLSEYTQSLLELRKAEVAIRGLLLVDGLTEPQGPVPSGHIESTPQPR